MEDQSNFNLKDEKILLERLRADDHGALKTIFGRYFRYLCVTSFHFIRDTEKAKDLAQDVFYELWKLRSKLEITSNLKSYLRRAIVNRSLNYLKSQRLDFSEPENTQISTATHEPSAQLLLEAETLEVAYQNALALLPPGCRAVFLLSRMEQKSQKEIAEQLDISPKTVENQITKALKILRNALGEFLE